MQIVFKEAISQREGTAGDRDAAYVQLFNFKIE